jgi:uncharacterized protein YbjT (DUF2867 family)
MAEESGRTEVSYWLGKEYWGKGIATRALSGFLAHVNAKRPIYARAASDNVASLRVLEKCGFTITGQDRGFANARGQEVSEFLLSLGANEPLHAKDILVAGSTGNLGRALVEVGLEQGHRITAVARRPEALAGFEASDRFEMVRAEVTRPADLLGICDGIDVVITALGVTRQRGPATFHDVDFQANLNLLNEATRAGVSKFLFTSGYGIDDALDTALYRAKKDFELALISSGMDYVIVRPTGFFSDMFMILDMARRGRVYLLGSGAGRINPIHLLDLADFYYLHLDDTNAILEVGGPDSYSFDEIAGLAFEVLGTKKRITHLPAFLIQALLPLVRPFSFNAYTEIKVFTRIMVNGAEAPQFGHRSLGDAYRDAVG